MILRRRSINACTIVSSLLLPLLAFTALSEKAKSIKEAAPQLKIIKDDLLKSDGFYFVKGTVHNPSDKPVKNVVIRYYVWKKWMGKEGHGTSIRDTGGLVSANIKYIPPKQSVDFAATGGDNAPVMTPESGLLPDPLDAEITVEWDK